jgi:hypothetical protein
MFKKSLPGIMAGLTRQFGLKLRFGSNPKTNGQTIWMPNVPLQVGERDKVKLMGDLVHECGHITQTSFTVLRDAKLTNSAADKLLHGIWNAVEDVRMERDTMKDLLGARQYLAGSLVYQTEDNQVRNGTASPSDAIITYCYCKGAIMVNGFLGVMPSYESSRSALIQLIADDGVAMLDDLLDAKMPLLRSGKKEGTADSFDLARDVVDLLKQMSQGQSQHQQQNKEQGESDKDQDQAQADQGSNDEQAQDQESQQQEGSQQSDDESDISGQDANGQQEADEGESKDESSNASGQGEQDSEEGNKEAQSSHEESTESDSKSQQMRQGAQSMLDDHNVDPSEFSQHDKVREEILERAKAVGVAFTDDVGEAGEDGQVGGLSDAPSSEIRNDLSNYSLIKSKISGDIALLRRRLIPKLESNNRSTSRLTEDRGRLDIRAAIRSVTSGASDLQVYREKVRRTTTKPAISLLVDRSLSMRDYGLMQYAQEAAIALLEVCDAATIKVEVIAFDHNVDMVKSFDMPSGKAKAKIGGIDANGGTDTAKAMYHAGKRLIQRPEGRKIMMVITDGAPASIADARSVHDLLKSTGIEIYGLGLGTDAVKHFCDQYSLVSGSNLATTVLQALEK